MLEIVLAQKIIDIVKQIMDGNGVDKVLTIHISIEKMSLLTPGLLQSRFAALTENTKLADTVLDIKSTPVVNHCENCNQIFASEDLVSNCIYCGWEYPRPVFGGSMKIEGIEVLDDVTKLEMEGTDRLIMSSLSLNKKLPPSIKHQVNSST